MYVFFFSLLLDIYMLYTRVWDVDEYTIHDIYFILQCIDAFLEQIGGGSCAW